MSTGNISSSSSILTLIEEKIAFVSGLMFLIFGVTCCFLNILLFYRRQFPAVSCCTYFLGASVAILIVVSVSGETDMYAAYYQNPMNYISDYCKIWYFLVQSTAMLYRWMLVVACLDCYALSSINARLRLFVNVYIARRVVALLVLNWIVLLVLLLVIYDLKAGSCVIVDDYVGTPYYSVLIIINTYGIPISVMIFCSLLIRRNMTNKGERRQQLNVSLQRRKNDKEHLQRKRDQQALVIFIAQIIVYIILTTPWIIFNIYNGISFGVPNKSADRLATERFLSPITGTMILLLPVVSFYVYTLTSGMFCKELFVMLRSVSCLKGLIYDRRIEPTTDNIPQRTLTVQ